jgi:hypothetical protein
VLEDGLDDFLGFVEYLDQVEVFRAIIFSSTSVAEPVDHALPEGRVHENDRDATALAGLDQGQCLEQFVQRAEAAGHHDIGAGEAHEHVFASEKMTEGLRDVLVAVGDAVRAATGC